MAFRTSADFKLGTDAAQGLESCTPEALGEGWGESTDFGCSRKGLSTGGGKLSHGPPGPCERGLRGRRVYAGSGSAPPTRGSWEKRSGRAGGCWAPNPRPRGRAAGAAPALSAGFVSCRFPSPEPASPWVLGAGRGADAGKSRSGPGVGPGTPGWTHRRLPPASGDKQRLNFRT